MSVIWYRGYKTFGIPKDVVVAIAAEIKKMNYGNHMPRICVEPINKKSEFYFFIGINSESPGIPPKEVIEFEKWLSLRRIRIFEGGDCVYHEELTKSWLKREVDITYTRQVSRLKFDTATTVNENPFDLSKEPELSHTPNQNYNNLLFWMSMNGDGSWQTFRNACAQLKFEKMLEPRHLFRKLRLLGHADYLDNASRWTICPPCLVQIDNTEDKYDCFLAGARNQQLLDSLPNQRQTSQVSMGAPDLITVSFQSADEAESVVSEIRKSGYDLELVGKVSSKLIDLLPDLEGWQNNLLKQVSVIPERYKIYRWDGDDFSQWVEAPNDFGMYQLTDTRNNEQALNYYFFYNPNTQSWFQGDWYGLRFLANWHLGNYAQFIYNMQERLLLIPYSYWLPDIYERAVVLASGKLPVRNDHGAIYKNVSYEFAQVLSVKLSASIERR